MSKTRHVMELQGRTRVVVENVKVVEVGMFSDKRELEMEIFVRK